MLAQYPKRKHGYSNSGLDFADFSSPEGTNLQILISKRYDEHPSFLDRRPPCINGINNNHYLE